MREANMKRAASIVVLTLFVSISLLGVVFGNHGESAYANENEGYDIGGGKVKTLIILGAGKFLTSHANFQEFLHHVELAEISGVNYDEWREILNDTISHIQHSRVYYYFLKILAAKTPYNQTFTGALLYFDYTGFREKHGLNKDIFSRVELLLRTGNVTGVYEEIFANTGEISGLLRSLKQDLDNDLFPGIPLLWEINQKYFDTQLFGQYAAMIFKEVK
jgi:hypothetical protein